MFVGFVRFSIKTDPKQRELRKKNSNGNGKKKYGNKHTNKFIYTQSHFTCDVGQK